MNMITETVRESFLDAKSSVIGILRLNSKKASAVGPVYEKCIAKYKPSLIPERPSLETVNTQLDEIKLKLDSPTGLILKIFTRTSHSTGETSEASSIKEKEPEREPYVWPEHLQEQISFLKGRTKPITYEEMAAQTIGVRGPVDPYLITPAVDAARKLKAEKKEQERKEAFKELWSHTENPPAPNGPKTLRTMLQKPKPPKKINWFTKPQDRPDIAQCDPKTVGHIDAILGTLAPKEEWQPRKLGLRARSSRKFAKAYKELENEILKLETEKAKVLTLVVPTCEKIVRKLAETTNFLDRAQTAVEDITHQLSKLRFMRNSFNVGKRRHDHLSRFEHLWRLSLNEYDGVLDQIYHVWDDRAIADKEIYSLRQNAAQVYYHQEHADRIQKLFEVIHAEFGTSHHLMLVYLFPLWHHFDLVRKDFIDSESFEMFRDMNAVLNQSDKDNCEAHALMTQADHLISDAEDVISRVAKDMVLMRNPLKQGRY